MDNDGHLFQDIPIKMDSFLPQTAIDYPVYIQRKPLALGKSYIAKLHLNYEHNHTLDYTTTFQVPLLPNKAIPPLLQSLVATPPDLVALLGPWLYGAGTILLLLIMGSFFYRSRRADKVLSSIRNLSRKSRPKE